MAVYKNRAKAPAKETWDIQSIIGKQSVEKRVADGIKIAEGLVKQMPDRLKSADHFFNFLNEIEKFELTIHPAFFYLSMACAEDTLSPLNSTLAEAGMRIQPYMVALSTLDAQDIANKDKVLAYLKDKRLEKWRSSYEKLFMKAEHQLPEQLARYKASIDQAFNDNNTIFTTLTDAEIKYEPALDAKGKAHEVSTQTISILLRDDDRVLRKNAYLSYGRGWLKYKETLSRLLSGEFLASFRLAQSVKYANQVESSMDSDNAKPELVLALYKAAKANLTPLKRAAKASRAFIAARLKISPVKVEPYDGGIELIGSKKVYTVAQAAATVAASVSLLGNEYADKVSHALSDRWIDYHMTPNKMSGAFSSSFWSVPKKLILMNFDGNIRSVSTLAHEMGHSMHSTYNHAANDYQRAGYPLFTAEVASIFSELMLIEHILKTEKDEIVRFRVLGSFIENFEGCVYTQLEMSEYEYRLVERLEKNDPASDWAALSKVYEEVRKPYVTDPDWIKKYGEATLSRAVTVPHYYMGFYVYKYAVGMIAALHLMDQVKKDHKKGVANYIKFIESGKQQWPLDILKSVGVDMLDQKVLKAAFDQYAKYLDEYIELGKKLLKVKGKL